MNFFYNIGVWFYGLAIFIAALFNEKARKWRRGRKWLFTELEKVFATVKEPVAWFHCASLGEFEQCRPVIEGFRKRQNGYKILLTFFSPSGYEVRQNYKGADYIFYLPLDTPANARRFVKITQPKIAVFVKYEFWYNYLQALHWANVPTYLISAIFRPGHYFFKKYGKWFRNQLHNYKMIFLQDTGSEELLKRAGINNIELSGDTRFDRVAAIAEDRNSDSKTEKFKGEDMLWICGSTWHEDEKIIADVFRQLTGGGEKIRLLIVPHETGEDHITRLLSSFPGAILYSGANPNDMQRSNVMVVDKVGLLSSLYRYADIAYIGGGFGKGIHNLPEAAVYGVPVIFGANHYKFIEASELIKRGGGFSISSADELLKVMSRLLNDKEGRQRSGNAGKNYILSAKGATDKIIREIVKDGARSSV